VAGNIGGKISVKSAKHAGHSSTVAEQQARIKKGLALDMGQREPDDGFKEYA
jgi:hypothetical protein